MLATIGPDGLPHVTALWFFYDEDRRVVWFSLNTAHQVVKNLRARPEAAFLVIARTNPYRTLQIQGRAEVSPDDDYAFADGLGQKYDAGEREMDAPGDRHVIVTLRPTKVHTWGH